MSLAVIVYTDNKIRFTTPEKGVKLWRAKQGKMYLNKSQRAYIKRVKRVFLNPDIAPADYVAEVHKPKVEQGTQVEFWWQRYDNLA